MTIRAPSWFPGLWFEEKSTRLYHRGEDNDAYINADSRGAGSSASERLHSATAAGNAGAGSVLQPGRYARHGIVTLTIAEREKPPS